MGLTALKLFIWLLPVFTPTTQGTSTWFKFMHSLSVFTESTTFVTNPLQEWILNYLKRYALQKGVKNTFPCTELMKLRQNPKVTAECDKHVTLNCEINSSPKGLSIKSMEWSLNKTSLCSWDMKKNITRNPVHTLSHFHCHYKHGQLTLNLSKMRPLESASSNFMCKFISNMGTDKIYTAVELQGKSPIIALMNVP